MKWYERLGWHRGEMQAYVGCAGLVALVVVMSVALLLIFGAQ